MAEQVQLAYASRSPGVGGQLKLQAGHFVVTELEHVHPDGGQCRGGRDARWEAAAGRGAAQPSGVPGVQLQGDLWGEHVFVRVEREGYTTAEVQHALAHMFGLHLQSKNVK